MFIFFIDRWNLRCGKNKETNKVKSIKCSTFCLCLSKRETFKMGWGSRMDSCSNCMKYSLFIVNFIIFVGGLVVVALGIWTVVDKSFANHLLGTNLYEGAAYILLVTGILVTFISCLGCLGALKEVRCMLVIYFIVLFLIFITMLIGGIIGYVFREKIDNTIRFGMRSSLRDYGNYQPVTDAWDETQTRLRCCGIDDYRDWVNRIPLSCCKMTASGIRLPCQNVAENNHFTIFEQGCLDVTKEYVKSHAIILGTAGIIVACLMILGMIFSFSLYKAIE